VVVVSVLGVKSDQRITSDQSDKMSVRKAESRSGRSTRRKSKKLCYELE